MCIPTSNLVLYYGQVHLLTFISWVLYSTNWPQQLHFQIRILMHALWFQKFSQSPYYIVLQYYYYYYELYSLTRNKGEVIMTVAQNRDSLSADRLNHLGSSWTSR